MQFKQYINAIETGQAMDAHEVSDRASTSIDNPLIESEVNTLLLKELNDGVIHTPQAGIQKIRKVLHRFGLDMPALYDLDTDGDEFTFDVIQYDNPVNLTFLYVLYFLDDSGIYEFYAQIGDEETINSLVSEVEEEDTEED